MTDLDDLPEISDTGEVSASEDEADESQHLAFLEGISKLGKNEKDNEKRTESSSIVSEFTVGETGTEKVNVEQLLEALGDKRKLVALSRKVKRVVKRNSALPSPLTSIEVVKINREIGYKAVSDELNKWNNIVREHRVAEKLRFPLKRPAIPLQTSENVVKRFKPATPLENEIALLLEKKEDRGKEEEVEASVKPPITVDEALQWRQDAKKLRAVQSYEAAKARRQKKIKSKSYHRILKRERLNRQAKEFDALKDTDPEQFLKKLETLDKQRILERMTLKHRGTGKWAKAQKFRAKYDDDSRKALTEQLQLNRLLTMKHQGQLDDDDNDEDEEQEIQERMDINGQMVSNQSGAPITDQDSAKDVSVDPNNFVTVTKEIRGSSHPKIADSGDFEESESEEDQRAIIEEAFADDDVVDQFRAAKQAIVDKSKPKEIDLTLPGWGEWGGKGIRISQHKRRRFIKPAPPAKPRKDDRLSHVIINEKQNKNLMQHVVSAVPHPYQNAEQFEHSMKIPLGNTWNPETSFRQMVVPNVITKMGSIIEPINMEVLSSAGKRKRGKRLKKR